MATRAPFEDLVSAHADIAGVTEAVARKALQTIGQALAQVMKASGLQSVEIPGLGVFTERTRSGEATPPGQDDPVAFRNVRYVTFKGSDVLSRMLQVRSGNRNLLEALGGDEETYHAIVSSLSDPDAGSEEATEES